MLEVEGLPDTNSSPTAATENKSEWSFITNNSAPEDSASAEITGEDSAATASPRETRSYKGAIYEKGEDGKWHLQKN